MISVRTMVGALRMVHEVYGYKLGRREHQSVSDKGAGHIYFMEKLVVLSVFRQFQLFITEPCMERHEMPLSTEAHRQPPTPQSFLGKRREKKKPCSWNISQRAGELLHLEHLKPREFKSSVIWLWSSRWQLWPRTLNNWKAEPLSLRKKIQHSHEMSGVDTY